jgi:hypothetical protein
MLSELNPEKVCFIIVKMRELDAQVPVEGDEASDPADDNFSAALTDANDKPVRAELRQFIQALDEDEQAELVALYWLGRGDSEVEDWDDSVAEAKERKETPTANYLMDDPLLADYLEDGLSEFDLSCEDFEKGSL